MDFEHFMESFLALLSNQVPSLCPPVARLEKVLDFCKLSCLMSIFRSISDSRELTTKSGMLLLVKAATVDHLKTFKLLSSKLFRWIAQAHSFSAVDLGSFFTAYITPYMDLSLIVHLRHQERWYHFSEGAWLEQIRCVVCHPDSLIRFNGILTGSD